MDLLIAVHIAQCGDSADPLHQNGGPLVEVLEMVGLQSVLVLGAAEPPADVDILNSLEVKRGTWNLCQLSAEARDHLIGADFSLLERLELGKHASGIAAASAGEGRYRIHGRIFHDDFDERLHLLGKGAEGDGLVGLNGTVDAPSILLREKALRHNLEKIEIQTDGADGDKQYAELMAQYPAETKIVAAKQSVKCVLEDPVEEAMTALLVPQEARAHHWRGRE